MSTTEENLKEAFAGESQANRKYLAFAAKAEQEGYKEAAKLFRAAAEAETVHAHNHLRELKGIRSTKENLQFKTMYPAMIEEAKTVNNQSALRSFQFANDVEKVHAALYQKVLDNLGKNEAVDYYICKVCGNTVESEPPDICPVCNAKKAAFYKVD
jgi:rubrerythrin